MTERPPRIGLVTVTYGQRWSMLRQCLAAARHQGVAQAWVVDNGAQDDIAALAKIEFGEFVEVIRLSRNSGSAGGFKAGLSAAAAGPCDFILILDDDNCPESGMVDTLVAAHAHHAQEGGMPIDRLAVMAYRPSHQADIVNGHAADAGRMRSAEFFNFRLVDIPGKVLRRLPLGRRPSTGKGQPPFIRVVHGIYGGLFFHRSLLHTVGVPDETYVLYGDDIEFTHRITQVGGGIFLHPAALIHDLEVSWANGDKHGNTFDCILAEGSDFRAYYTMRNTIYWQSRLPGQSNWLRQVNRVAFLAILKLRAKQLDRMTRYDLLREAIGDADRGLQGVSPRFPLP